MYEPATFFYSEQTSGAEPVAPWGTSVPEPWGSPVSEPEFVPAPAVFPLPNPQVYGYAIAPREPRFDPATESSALWMIRGLVVGLSLGAAFGSFVPVLGTAVGGVVGMLAGFGLGVVISIICAVTRKVAPRSPGTTSDRERIIAIMTIVLLATMASSQMNRGGGAFLWLAAAPGIVHAALANPPVAGAIYTGVVSAKRARLIRLIPVAVLVVAIAVFFGLTARSRFR